MSKIIYKNQSSNIQSDITIITPSPEALETMTVEQVARKDVPTGFAYKIVDDDFVPTDRTFRNAWTIDDAELTDGVGD
tara:strand:+ start:2832 stop:3065 length:234 start_codon:yes stop_codon:yes gene_type:complete